MQRRLILKATLAAAALLAGCATRQGEDGKTKEHLDPKYLFKTDIDRVIDTSREQIVTGLLRIADKLYRRNPREWRRAGAASREMALARLKTYQTNPPARLDGHQEGAAALLAFNPGYDGDRVEALLYGLLTMVDAAYEHKDDFFILDTLNEQKFYNCARNMEIAFWKLATSRDAAGRLLLLANEISEEGRNLSFEREFGRIIGLLEFMSKIIADKNGRLISRAAQSLATSLFLPVGALK
jgi:hypothetical protein